MQKVFHVGELAVQKQAGVAGRAARVGSIIQNTLPPFAQEFLSQQPFAIISMADEQGRIWASLLTGEPGFLWAESDEVLQVDALPLPADPLFVPLTTGNAPAVGLLAIEPETRRRIRVNGIAQARPDDGFTIRVQQAYANCPKYIQAREIQAEQEAGKPSPHVQRGESLTEAQQNAIRQADTFFIASAHPEAGADASHRGGNPGFVRVLDANTLHWPDYAGNSMFNTLGNLAVNPKAGLLFVDFETGSTLQLTGQATILWDAANAVEFTGAERVVTFAIEEVLQTEGAVPLRGLLLDYSPFNPATDTTI